MPRSRCVMIILRPFLRAYSSLHSAEHKWIAPGWVTSRLYQRSKNRRSVRNDPERRERFCCLLPRIHSRSDFFLAPQLSQMISTMTSRVRTSSQSCAWLKFPLHDCPRLSRPRAFALPHSACSFFSQAFSCLPNLQQRRLVCIQANRSE